MTLTELTTALHRWADKHGAFPDAMLCNMQCYSQWREEGHQRFNIALNNEFKGVTILPILSPDDTRILFASSPDA